MHERELIDLKERIVCASRGRRPDLDTEAMTVTPDERDWLLDAINEKAAVEQSFADAAVHMTPMGQKQIDQLYIYLSHDPGGEGICAATVADLGTTVLVTPKEQVAKALLGHARELARKSGRDIRLVRFKRDDVLMTIPP